MPPIDNLRKFRREIAGRGVNIRTALIAGVAAATDVLVADLLDGDEVVKSIEHSAAAAPTILTLAMARKASVDLFTTNKIFRVLADYAANEPQKIYVQIVAGPANDGLRVSVVPHASVKGADIIRVSGSTTDGATILSTAAQVVQAINIEPQASKIATASLPSGTGATAVTATGPHALGAAVAGDVSASVTGFVLAQGPKAGFLDVQAAAAGVRYTAKKPGLAGNSIRIRYLDPAGNDKVLSVTVSGLDITVNLATSGAGAITSTAALIAAAVNNAEAGKLVSADPLTTGADVVIAAAFAALATGRDTGRLQFVEDTTANVIELEWIGRA